jgi:hypothetical protein
LLISLVAGHHVESRCNRMRKIANTYLFHYGE